jgi:prevent-host-death family protein
MRISVSAAKGLLSRLVKLAEAGDEVILTRRGTEVARLGPIVAFGGAASRRALMARVRASASTKAAPGPDAAHSQDSLYDNDGISASPGQGERR